ncbi:hypothetical protein BKA82DRAFT_4018739 [Pisolithus tinctorius]|nr:hypothetical protein BKA82DRAFT_4018739 [Pisolithus tinctorius]
MCTFCDALTNATGLRVSRGEVPKFNIVARGKLVGGVLGWPVDYDAGGWMTNGEVSHLGFLAFCVMTSIIQALDLLSGCWAWVQLSHLVEFVRERFSKHTVIAAYKKEVWTYEVHTLPIWEWALDILALHFIWDAQHLFKHDGHGFECFYDEPWTSNSWWDIQSSLLEVLNAVPFAFIIYTNNTKLSSFGTATGYPVVVCCANLLVEIQNSHTIGGGCIVGWLPVVPKDTEEEGKLGYTTLKCIVWHESFSRLLSDIMQHSKTGYIHTSHHDQITRNSVCTPANAHAQHSCTEGKKVLKALRLQPVDNVFWLICNSDLYDALSFDHQHFLHGGLWGKHILWDILRILNILGTNGNKMHDLAKAMFYALLKVFTRMATPKGYCLLCILASYLQLDSLIEMIDAELLKFDNKLKAYIECVNKSGLEGLRVDWDFPKVHLWKNVAHNIWTKGATRNYSMCLNESMHGPIKEAYECQSNGRDFTDQMLHVDEHKLAAKLLRMRVNNYKNWTQMQGEPAGTKGEWNDNQSGLFMVFDHVYLSSSSKPSTVQDIEASHSVSNTAFVGFCKKLLGFCNQCLPQYGYQVDKWIAFPTHFEASDLLMNFFKLMPSM